LATGIGAKGNEGVTQIQQTQGSGYVEYGYATQNSLPVLWKINLVITLPRRQS